MPAELLPELPSDLRREWDAIDAVPQPFAHMPGESPRALELSKRLWLRHRELGSYRKLADEVGRDKRDVERWVKAAPYLDALIIRTVENVRLLHRHVEKWGPVLGSMPADMAFEYLQGAEQAAARVRAMFEDGGA